MRAPDLIIGPVANPYLRRWIIFKWRGWQLCLHKITRSDDDRALHDHTGDNISLLLRGEYTEFPGEWGHGQVYCAGQWIFRKAEAPHRLVLNDGAVVWTLWLRWPSRREWGFHCPQGWRHWRDYTDGHADGNSLVGRGCDD